MHRESEWTLSPRAFNGLLRALDPDRDRAAQLYEQLRGRMIGLLQWWGTSRAPELADETLDRVARRLDEGATVPRGSFGAYVRGVARLVFYEASREPREVVTAAELVASPEPDSHAAMTCLDRCLDSLEANDRSLVLRYYDSDRKIEARQKLAAERSMSITALRVRTHRLRERLEVCVQSCLAGS